MRKKFLHMSENFFLNIVKIVCVKYYCCTNMKQNNVIGLVSASKLFTIPRIIIIIDIMYLS